jgi:hypothetical protein
MAVTPPAGYVWNASYTGQVAVCVPADANPKIKFDGETKETTLVGNSLQGVTFKRSVGSNCVCTINISGTLIADNRVQVDISGTCSNCSNGSYAGDGQFNDSVIIGLDNNSDCRL